METKTTILEKIKLSHLVIALPLAGFLIPFLVPGNQILTGTLVNSFLFIFALKFSKQNIFFISVFPSVGAFANGLVFGPYTPFLLYFLPFIWISNTILIKVFIKSKQIMPAPAAVFVSALLKSAVLFLPALLFVNFHVVPKIFLTAMGVLQLATAVMGGILALAILKITKLYDRN